MISILLARVIAFRLPDFGWHSSISKRKNNVPLPIAKINWFFQPVKDACLAKVYILRLEGITNTRNRSIVRYSRTTMHKTKENMVRYSRQFVICEFVIDEQKLYCLIVFFGGTFIFVRNNRLFVICGVRYIRSWLYLYFFLIFIYHSM